MKIADIPVGNGAPLVLIAGQNVIESEETTLECARRLKEIAARHGLPLVFKASYDKANRSSLDSFRGPGIDEGLRILARVREDTGLPVTTDVHEPWQAKPVAEVASCLQIPAFLMRQTDLVAACAATGLPVNIKKAQFVAPENMHLAVRKAREAGAEAMLTERGTSFGYHDLVVDMRGLLEMRTVAPVCFDATHSCQRPGGLGHASDGNREWVAPLARAAIAIGIDALFVEVHADPANAPCDGPCQIDFDGFDRLLAQASAMQRAVAALD